MVFCHRSFKEVVEFVEGVKEVKQERHATMALKKAQKGGKKYNGTISMSQVLWGILGALFSWICWC